MRVLVVEDDPLLGDALAVGLKQRGFEPDWVQDGREAQTVMGIEPFAAIVLDLGLPGLTGLELLRTERARGNKVPVLILTARDAVQDRIKGLDSGADDYVVKPADLDELAARLRALVRRSGGDPAPLLHALVRAFHWQSLLDDCHYASVNELAKANGKNASYVAAILRLTLLAPEIVEAILDGHQPATIQLQTLIRAGVPGMWSEQRDRLVVRFDPRRTF